LEVAVLVGAHVDADRQAAGARRDHRIDETVVQEVAGGAERSFLEAVMPIRMFLPLLRWFGQGCGLYNRFFHNIQSTVMPRPTAHYTMLVKEWTFFGSFAWDRAWLVILMMI
jgi:hypothetical protein